MRLCSGNPPVWHLPDLSNCISKWMYDIKKMVSTGSALMSWCLCSEKGRTPLLPSHPPPPSPPKKNYCWSEFKLVRAANKFALCYPDGMIGSIKMEALHQVINYDLKLANVPLWFTWYINFPDNRKVISDTKSYWQSRIFRKLISYFISISSSFSILRITLPCTSVPFSWIIQTSVLLHWPISFQISQMSRTGNHYTQEI